MCLSKEQIRKSYEGCGMSKEMIDYLVEIDYEYQVGLQNGQIIIF